MLNPFRLAGPVFEFELLTTSRRGRYYAMRAGYALILLLVLWQVYEGWVEVFGRMMTPRDASRFAVTMFTAISVLQEVLVLALTPVMVAGVIAAEKQSKTLHYVLASPLNSAEVVMGKLLSRLLHVAVFLGVSLPVMSLLVLLGGVDPRLVALGCAVGVSSAWLLAAVAVLASTYARRVREALFLTYSIEALWLFGPDVLRYLVTYTNFPLIGVVDTVTEYLLASSPVAVGWQTTLALLMGGVATTVDDLLTMVAIQGVAGVVFAALAVWRLRPVFKGQEGTARRSLASLLGARGSLRRWGRPECSDRPLVWKELHTARGTLLSRVVGGLVTLVLGGPLLYFTVRYALAAFLELWEHGYWSRFVPYRDRDFFGGFLHVMVPLVFLVPLLRVAGAAAAAISSEHEEDTWVSLTATDLTAWEVVWSKLLGAVWGTRRLLVAVGLMTALGVFVGSLHPLSVVSVGLSLAVFTWFAAALGVWVSMHLKSTGRAQFLTVAGLIFVNVAGQTVLNLWKWPPPMVWPGFMAVDVSRALFEVDYLNELVATAPGDVLGYLALGQADWGAFWNTELIALSLTIDGTLAGLLTWAAVRRFSVAAGRGRRSLRPPQTAGEPGSPEETGRLAAPLPVPAVAD
jgi:ABC-type transport system involved in multi-copper enzyme maturation permease subunit